MDSLHSSMHYVWDSSNILGHGASGGVYLGLCKETGEHVAIKPFTKNNYNSDNMRMRECQALTKLSHENIVKLLAVEEEGSTKQNVLVMEFCNGGNLYEMLNEPQNSYGLEESEFLRVLHDLFAGIKYLREQSWIHRDIKPGNLMKCITEDGRTVYKLVDFDTARELQEDEEFVSLYGTEEFLFPDMFNKAIMKQEPEKKFCATVDLWSIGVTLYYAAAGSLPFRPYGGRVNKEIMQYILFNKKPGVISGIQHVAGGPVEWSKELPKTCLLSQGLRQLLERLLAGILERDAAKIWTYDQFFDCTSDILTRRAIHVFYVNEGKEICLYMKPDQILKDIQDQIAEQLEVPRNNQMLLYHENVLENVVSPNSKIGTYPEMTSYHPLVLLHNESIMVEDLSCSDLLFYDLPEINTTVVNFNKDIASARLYCKAAYALKRLVEKLIRCRDLLLSVPKQLVGFIHDSATKLCGNLDGLSETVADLDRRFCWLDKNSSVVSEFLNCWSVEHEFEEKLKMEQVMEETKQLKDELHALISSLHTSVDDLKKKAFGMSQKESDLSEQSRCIEKANSYVNKIHESWQVLVKNRDLVRKGRGVPHYIPQFHNVEKVKMTNNGQKLLAVVHECITLRQQAFQRVASWYSSVVETMTKCECVGEEIIAVRKLADYYTSTIEEAELKSDELHKMVITQFQSNKAEIADKMAVTEEAEAKKLLRSKFDKQLDDLTANVSSLKEEIQINDSLIERFRQINLGSTSTQS